MPNPTVDLTNCDREPIHIPGAIQPHGVLLVVDETDLRVIQSSANAEAALELPRPALGSTLEELLGSDAASAVHNALRVQGLRTGPQYPVQLRPGALIGNWSGSVHRSDGVVLLELQAEPEDVVSSTRTQDTLRRAISDLDTRESLLSFCQAATLHFQELTGFDRVMVYRFLEDGTGVVLAETRQDDMEPYLGLHYPASDIPAQARELYRLNPYRLTADVHALPVPLDPVLNPATGRATDLSLCALRATSPIHIEYLHNMGVSASLSFSLLHLDNLWGLIACHHRSERELSQHARVAAEILARFVGLQVELKEEAEQKYYATQLQQVRSVLRDQLASSGDYVPALMDGSTNLLSAIYARGVALCTGSRIVRNGETPPMPVLEKLCTWIHQQPWRPVWSTNELSTEYPDATSIADVASGILLLRVAQRSPEAVIWFRPELRRTVNWAGNPTKALTPPGNNGEVRLHPRKSFTLWQEKVSGQSAPWRPLEWQHAMELREDMAQALLAHRALEVSRLNDELQRSNRELEQFAAVASHDLQQPLRTINAYTQLLFRDRQADFNDADREKIAFIVDATRRMTSLIRSLLEFSQSGRNSGDIFPVKVADALALAMKDIQTPLDERKAQVDVGELPVVRAEVEQLARIFVNLISNSLKYCPRDRQPHIRIGAEQQRTEWVISVQDNGAGFDPAESKAIFQSFYRLGKDSAPGTGLGLAICEKIIRCFNGRIWADSVPGQGSTFSFALPDVSGLSPL